MEELIITELYVYPIKSLGGVRLKTASLEERGIKHDRRWMLRDRQGNFLTQRKLAQMAFLQVEIEQGGLKVTHTKKNISSLYIPFHIPKNIYKEVQIWADTCLAQTVDPEADKWFSEALGFECELVYMPDDSERFTNPAYTLNNEKVSFADAMPYLITGTESLHNLNSKAAYQIPITRFRPNIVFKGGTPFCEDNWKYIDIAGNQFQIVKPCGRCVVTTIDIETAEKGTEPLKTLSTYRNFNGSIQFGQYMTTSSSGTISVGDKINVLIRK